MTIPPSEQDLSGSDTDREFWEQIASIALGQTVSSAIDYRHWGSGGLVVPVGFSGTTISFLVSADNLAFVPLYDNATNTLVSMTVAANRSYTLPAQLQPWHWFQIVAGTAAGAAESLVIVLKG